jgi:hypothetical protein
LTVSKLTGEKSTNLSCAPEKEKQISYTQGDLEAYTALIGERVGRI